MRPKLRSSAHDATVDSIISYIRDNRLTPGSRLPSERELADTLQVSRHTVREAYLSLAARGLVVIEHGRGIFLVTRTDEVAPFPLITDLADLTNIVNLLEVRQLIECGAIPLAMAKAQAEDYGRLRELVNAEAGHPQFHDSAVIPSVSFESEIVNLTGNQALISIENNVMSAWKNLWTRLQLSTIKPMARTDEHHEIIDAMENGDARLAQKCLHAHLSSILLVIDRASQQR